MAQIAALRTGGTARLVRIGGAAGVVGGLAWVVKGIAILAVDEQPPVVLELALPLFGLSLVGVALLTSRSVRRTIVVCLAWLAVAAGLVALVSELLDLAWDESIAAASLALLLGQLTLPRSGRAPAALTFWLGVGTLPALAVGGALAEIDERLLEIPLVCVGLAWMLVGWLTLRTWDAVPASP
ncbi:hypothetical protein EXE59_11965 [Nocardioides eburneiflavus]|uniref:Uncharacterized protein n=1 Tax=Nocardioides eburneiflavus TaxID=2518372 RepID=A0A4Z1CKG5_9ACTN|nr:hypothetical protein [Nocardioides eburneiflavus]TGN64600.1 hypothetical protein EXE59_11965 [Nocardioides eburneiflavus]